jgi:hypothetical protein
LARPRSGLSAKRPSGRLISRSTSKSAKEYNYSSAWVSGRLALGMEALVTTAPACPDRIVVVAEAVPAVPNASADRHLISTVPRWPLAAQIGTSGVLASGKHA